ncbi:MAG TPA: 3-hydroxyacyl-CoA dehydrogenase family protein [Bryobacteraceae bacterium]|nr:3-hydroxyacyl-CoA dehydrogenase family protein [Bryobacteraceae bacterium]
MPIEFTKAAVIGTGMMGPGIAVTLALSGLPSTILSRTADGASRGVEKARAQVELLAANELADASVLARAPSLITGSGDFDETIRAADLVIESAPENLSFKQDLFARMDALAAPHAVLASNTSGLSITAIAARCKRPERVLTTHFWNPAHLIPLVEIIKGEKTSPEAADAVRGLLAACGKTPVMVRKDRPGQLGNRLQMALLREAAYIVEDGIADAGDIDSVIKNGLGLRMPAYGTLEHMDITGVDLALSVNEYVTRDLYNEPRAPEYLRDLVRRGETGVKAGRGFYDWSSKSADQVKAGRDEFLVQVLGWRRRKETKAQGQAG